MATWSLLIRHSAKTFVGPRIPWKDKLPNIVCTAAYGTTFRCRDLTVQKARSSKLATVSDNPPFGTYFTDHMFEVEWSIDAGWSAPRIVPYHNLELNPAAKVFHYATECFEGMKACRGNDNKIRIFRPELHIERMLRSVQRAALPTFNGDELLKGIVELLKIDQEWVPKTEQHSLYIRPTVIGTEPALGVKAARSCLLYVLCSPVGTYRSKHFRDSTYISLLVNPQMQRVCAGGVALAKMGCNYAPTVFHLDEANRHKCEDVLYLTGEDQLLTEATSMNIFVVLATDGNRKELVTAPATDFVLPGITRRSYVELASGWQNVQVSERYVTMKEIVEASKSGRLLEVFGCGTATVVSPVGRLVYVHDGVEEEITITEDEENSISARLKKEIQEIKIGLKMPEWTLTVC